MFDSFVRLIAQHNHFIATGAFTKSSDHVGAHPCLDERWQGLVAEAVEHFYDLIKLFKQLELNSSVDQAFVILIGFKVLKSTFPSSKDTVKIAFGIKCFQLYRFDLEFKVVYSVACGSN